MVQEEFRGINRPGTFLVETPSLLETSPMSHRIPRREFLGRTAVAGAAVGLGVWSSRSLAESKSPNEKLNIAMIGTANQARFSIDNVKQENIVALCDIDDNYLA